MNKLFTKIGVTMVGIAMAVGVGVAVGRDNTKEVRADSTVTYVPTDFSTTAGKLTVNKAPITCVIENGCQNASNGDFRIYSGKYIQLTISSGSITGITFTFNSTNSGTLSLTSGGGSYTSPSWSGTSTNVKLTTSGQVRVDSMVVSYSSGSDKEVTVSISGSLTKTTYKTTDSWSTAGLTASGVYDTSTPYTGSFNWTFNPATPAAMGLGTNQDLTITASVSDSGYSGFTTKVVKVDVTAKNDFSSVVQDGHYYRIYSPVGEKKYYLEENGTSNAKAPTAALTGTVFLFNLVGDNTWTIKNDGKYLYSTSSAGAKYGTTVDSWVLAVSTVTSVDGTYSLQETKNSKFLSLYSSTPDWRSYDSVTTNRAANIMFEEYTAGKFADDVIASTQAVCDEGYNNAKSDFTDAWTFLANKYTTLLDEDKVLLVDATYTRDGSTVTATGTTTQQVAEGVARHDYLVKKYGLDNLLTGRVVPTLSRVDLGFASNNNSVALIIVIISSVALVTIIGCVVLHRRKED